MLSPRWTTIILASRIGLLVTGLLSCFPTHSHITRIGLCAEKGLIPYSSRELATEKGTGRRCTLIQGIEREGDLIPAVLRGQVLKELWNRFSVEITYDGTVALPKRTIEYLLVNVQETATLVGSSSGVGYKAVRTESTQGPESFFVTDEETFTARFTYLRSHNSDESSEHMFFESGHATVFFWRIWGNSFIRYKLMAVNEQESYYDIKVYVFTESRLLKAILRSGVFQYFSNAMFTKILGDVETAVHEFKDTPRRFDRLSPQFVEGLKQALR